MIKNLHFATRGQYLVIVLLAAAIVVSDQFTKQLIVDRFGEGEGINIIPNFFNLVLVYNKGAAFGMLGGLPDSVRYIALGVTTVFALFAVLWLFFSSYIKEAKARAALALIIGGAIGNVIDRVNLGKVVDFLDFFVGSYHWPAFNVADSAICIGVALLLFTNPDDKAPEVKADE